MILLKLAITVYIHWSVFFNIMTELTYFLLVYD